MLLERAAAWRAGETPRSALRELSRELVGLLRLDELLEDMFFFVSCGQEKGKWRTFGEEKLIRGSLRDYDAVRQFFAVRLRAHLQAYMGDG